MAQIDFSSAYRDSTKGATLKALALRRQEAAEAQTAAMAPRQIASPWQGAAQIAETLGSGIREGLAASQEQAGRSRLAELLAGGISPEEMGEATILDPDLAMKHQEHAWQAETQKTTEENLRARELMKHGWDVDAATERARVEKEQQERLFGQQDVTREDEQAAAAETAKTLAETQKTKAEQDAAIADAAAQRDAALKPEFAQIDAAVTAGTMTPEDAATQKDLLKRKAEADIAQSTPEQIGPMTPELAAKWGIPERDRGKYKVNETTGEPELINPTAGGAQAEKNIWDTKETIVRIDADLNKLDQAFELAPKMLTGAVGEYIANFAAKGGEMGKDFAASVGSKFGVDREAIDATLRFYQLMDDTAISEMTTRLSGATAAQEMNKFIQILSNRGTSPTQKQKAIDDFKRTLLTERGMRNERLISSGAPAEPDYTYTSSEPTNSTAPAAPAAPAAGGTTEPSKPADIPQVEWDNMTPDDKALFR